MPRLQQLHAVPTPIPDIGFEVLRGLAVRNEAPTPDAYRAMYDHIAGTGVAPQSCIAQGQWSHAQTRRYRASGVSELNVQLANQRIQALESQLQQLNGLVQEDQLTGCLNRRGLDEATLRELNRANRLHTPLCAAMLDLDNFKQLNDHYGHCVGDEVLVHLVHVIRQTLRSIDVIARFGGEEFLILLPNTAQEEGQQALARLQRNLAQQIFVCRQQRLTITFSAGIALHT
ncbi:MAG: GGDEF domain-containing protein, partial [Herbaspirillum sp.]